MASSHGYWRAAGERLWRDRLARVCVTILAFYFLLVVAASFGWIAKDWNEEVC